MQERSLANFIQQHRDIVIPEWKELWDGIQRRRPQSHFPDPPYESILEELPYQPDVMKELRKDVSAWLQASPMFCVGAVFCQLHVTIAALLYQEHTRDGARILSELEQSIESLMLDAGTRRWITTLVTDDGRQETLHTERLAVVGQLAAGVAHEIGNPLASISSIVQLLLRRQADPQLVSHLENINHSIDRMSRIVRDLVDFSRPVRDIRARIDINDAVEAALHLITYDRRASRIQFSRSHATVLPPIMGLPDQLSQVFLNLLINAVDAIGEHEGSIRTTTRSDADRIFIDIHDTGPGMPREILPRIFDPFFSTKAVGKGTGLGLSVSYGIVKKHGGRIDVQSDAGSGTTFTVILPVASLSTSR